MLRTIQKHLAPVRRRLTMRRAIPATVRGLLLAGWIGIVCGLLALFGAEANAAYVGGVIVVLFPTAALALVLLRPASWRQAARAVDRHFDLQDRVGTALYLAEHSSPEPFDSLQIEDALKRLQQIKAAQAVKLNIAWQGLLGGLILCGLAVAIMGWAIVAPPQFPTGNAQTTVVDQQEDDQQPTPLESIPVDPSLAQRSLQLEDDGAQTSRALTSQASQPDLADRYFDAMQARWSEPAE